MKILLIFPTIFEAQSFFKRAGKKAVLGATAKISLSGNLFVGIVSGIGCKTSQDRVREIQEKYSFDFAILCGFCGACKEVLSEGDFVFETEILDVSNILKSMNVRACKIAFIKEVADFSKKLELSGKGFEAVEMESGFFKPIFKNFVHLRVVSDGVNSKIPAEFFNSLMDFNTGSSSFSITKFLKLLVKKPTLPFTLINFAISANKVKKIYDSKLFEFVKKISDFYLQNQNKNKIL